MSVEEIAKKYVRDIWFKAGTEKRASTLIAAAIREGQAEQQAETQQREKEILKCLSTIADQQAEIDRLKYKNRELNIALFHVENGLAHPDEEIRLLIQAAEKASQCSS